MIIMKLKKTLSRIKGFLTNEDIELLEEAGMRKPSKYQKVFTKKWLCTACSYNWFYSAIKCPACASQDIREV